MSLRVALARNPVVTAGTAVALIATGAFVGLGWAVPSAALGAGSPGSGTTCTPASDDGRFGLSVAQVHGATSGLATVTGVELLGAEGLDVVGFALRPEDQQEPAFVGASLEEMGSTPSLQPVGVAPDESAFVAVELASTTADRAHMDGIRVHYTVEGRFGSGFVDFGFDVTTPAEGETCDSVL